MSQVIVAHNLTGASLHSKRTLSDQLALRHPGIADRTRRRLSDVSPSSIIRRGVVRRQVISAASAIARRDHEVWLGQYIPGGVHEWSTALSSLGFPERAEGREAIGQAMDQWYEAWESWAMDPCYVIDRGDLLITLNRLRAQGATSGIEVDIDDAAVLRLRDGFVTHGKDYNDWDAALRAGGLDPRAMSILRELNPGAWTELPQDLLIGEEQPLSRASGR